MKRALFVMVLTILAALPLGYIGYRGWLPAVATASSCIEHDQLYPLSGRHSQPAVGDVPVIFVHGITSSYQTWTNRELNGGASIASQVAAIPGTSVSGFDYSRQSLDWVTNPAIGRALARAITCLTEITRKRVILIDHSMGGLATQFAAAQPDGNGTVADHIAEVITLGTPYKGSKLLTAIQLALKGSEDLADPEIAAGAEALLSACAGISEAGLAPGNHNPCSILAVARSPIGTALEYDSPQIAALPRWGRRVAVKDIDGNIDLRLSIFFVHRTVNFGDVLVSHDSAVAHNTDGTPFDVTCSLNGFESLIGPGWDCYHGKLPKNPEIVSYVVSLVRRLVAKEDNGQPIVKPTSQPELRPTPPPNTTTPTTSTSPAPTGTVPTCVNWLRMNLSDRLAAVARMQAAHHDHFPVEVAYGSVRLFCVVYPHHTIDGVYDGRL